MPNPLLARFAGEPALVAHERRDRFEACLDAVMAVEHGPAMLREGAAADDGFWPAADSWKAAYRPYVVVDGVLQIPVKGVLLHDFSYALGGWATGYVYIRRAFDRGMADPAVKGIALLCDSPGGEVAGCFDLVDAMRASASPALTHAYGLARALCVGLETACLGEAFLAEARSGFGDQQAASAARDRITGALDGAVDRVAAALGQAAATALTTAAGQCCARLSDLAGTLQPLMQIEAGRSFPSTALAWSLYCDPARAPELVARARCGTPFHMPAKFVALAPARRT